MALWRQGRSVKARRLVFTGLHSIAVRLVTRLKSSAVLGQQGRSVSPRRMILLVAHRPVARLATSLERLCLLAVAGVDDLRFVVIVLLK
jgi:hypothetical protein